MWLSCSRWEYRWFTMVSYTFDSNAPVGMVLCGVPLGRHATWGTSSSPFIAFSSFNSFSHTFQSICIHFLRVSLSFISDPFSGVLDRDILVKNFLLKSFNSFLLILETLSNARSWSKCLALYGLESSSQVPQPTSYWKWLLKTDTDPVYSPPDFCFQQFLRWPINLCFSLVEASIPIWVVGPLWSPCVR